MTVSPAGRIRLPVLFAVAFVDMVGLTMILPLLPFYAKDLGANATLIGFLIAAFSVAQLAVAPPVAESAQVRARESGTTGKAERDLLVIAVEVGGDVRHQFPCRRPTGAIDLVPRDDLHRLRICSFDMRAGHFDFDRHAWLPRILSERRRGSGQQKPCASDGK